MDLRRAFRTPLDTAPVRATSILNGPFVELLSGEAPIVPHRSRRVLDRGDADQPFDFTTKDDVADFTADAALDPDPPCLPNAGASAARFYWENAQAMAGGMPSAPLPIPAGVSMFPGEALRLPRRWAERRFEPEPDGPYLPELEDPLGPELPSGVPGGLNSRPGRVPIVP